MNKAIEALQKKLNDVIDLRDDIYNTIAALSNDIKSNKFTPPELCDFGFLCRELSKIADDLRKDVDAFGKMSGKFMTLAALQDPDIVNQVGDEDLIIRGTLATAKPKIVIGASRPQFGTAEHTELLRYFGVSGDAVEVVKVDWKQLQRRLTQLTEDGRALPPGIGKTFDDYKVTYRRKGKRE